MPPPLESPPLATSEPPLEKKLPLAEELVDRHKKEEEVVRNRENCGEPSGLAPRTPEAVKIPEAKGEKTEELGEKIKCPKRAVKDDLEEERTFQHKREETEALESERRKVTDEVL